MAKSRSQNRVLEGAIRTLFGHLKGGVHDPLPCGTHLYKRLTFGLESHQASLGQTVRDPKGLEFKPNEVIPPVGLGPVRAFRSQKDTNVRRFSPNLKRNKQTPKHVWYSVGLRLSSRRARGRYQCRRSVAGS